MSEERFLPDNPQEWLNRAKSNLIRARAEIKGVYLEDLCFDAQQAAEKAVKAVLIHWKVRFPYVHDLAELLTLVVQTGHKVPESVEQAARLTRYAVMARYPGLAEPVSRGEYEEAVHIAQRVVHWAEEMISTQTALPSDAAGDGKSES